MTDLVNKLAQHELISPAEYARRRGVSAAAVSKAIKRCRIPLIDGKLDPLVASVLWQARTDLDQQNRAMGQNRKAADQPPARESSSAFVADGDYSSIRRRRELAEARNAELDLEERLGKLVNREEVEKTGRRVGSAIVQQMDLIIDRIPAEFGVDDEHRRKMRHRLREEFDRIRAEFARAGMLALQ